MTDLLEHLRELQESRYCFMPGIVRDAANEIVALRQQVKELERWRESVLDQCMIAHSTFYANDPKKTLDELIDWHVKITLDPQASTRRSRNESR